MKFVEGGKERQDSVYEGLKHVTSDYVMIHDGARPFVKKRPSRPFGSRYGRT